MNEQQRADWDDQMVGARERLDHKCHHRVGFVEEWQLSLMIAADDELRRLRTENAELRAQLRPRNPEDLTTVETLQATVSDLQLEIGAWNDRTFPSHHDDRGRPQPIGPCNHLVGEVAELEIALSKRDPAEIGNELADCGILLYTIAHLTGVDLDAAIRAKHAINLKRIWGPADANGVARHVEAARNPEDLTADTTTAWCERLGTQLEQVWRDEAELQAAACDEPTGEVPGLPEAAP